MVHPVQPAASDSSIPFQPTTVNPLYKDQFGMSTLTQGFTSRKSIIVLGFLAVAAVLIIFLRKLFSTEPNPNEIDAWVEQNCNDLTADGQFRVARIIQSVSLKIQNMAKPDVEKIVYSILDTKVDLYTYLRTRDEEKKVTDCILRYFRDKNQEIQTWLLRTYKEVSEEVLVQVVQRVNEIERLPEYSRDSKALIRKLRLGSFIKPDPVQSKALSYLTQSKARSYLKSKYKSSVKIELFVEY